MKPMNEILADIVVASGGTVTSYTRNGLLRDWLDAVEASALAFTEQPQSTTVDEYSNASFSVSVTGGTAPYSYQWKKNGANIGTNSSALSFTAADADNGASVFCIASDALGAAVSNVASLRVNRNIVYFSGANAQRVVLPALPIISGADFKFKASFTRDGGDTSQFVIANWNGSNYGLSLYLTGDWINGAGGISLFGAGQIKSAFDKKIGERYDVEVIRANGVTSLYVNGVLERAETDLPPAVYNSTSYELASKNGTFNLIGKIFSHSVEINGVIVRDYRLNDGWANNPLCKNYSPTGSTGDGEYKNLTSSSWSVGEAREFVPDINLVVGHGQSLSIGDQGFPLTHTSETFGSNVRLFNGLAPIGAGYELELQDADIQSLVPFKESGKETHSWGMFNWINSTIQLNNYLYAAGGVGGKTISMLTDVIQDQLWGWKSVEKILNRVRHLGSYDIPFITWIHGEADSFNPVAENYKGDLREYHDRVKTLSGKNPPLILDQTGKNASNQISEVLLQYADENPDAYLAGPKYWLNRLYPEATGIRLHLNADGYMLQGEMIGECAKDVLNGVDFKPLQPTNLSIVDGSGYKTVKIDFHIPHDGVLTIDTTTLPAAPSLGMRLRTYSGSSAYAATSYNVVGNSIEFTFAEPITTDGLLEFGGSLDDRVNTDGVQLPCTNIRGSVGHQSLAVSGVTWYDWAVQFRKIPSDALNRDTDNLWVHGDYSGNMTANQIVLGRNPEWLLDGMSSVRVQCNVSSTSGVAYLWVFNTKVTLVNGVNDVAVNSNATRRMYLQGGASGFVGSVSGITITQV